MEKLKLSLADICEASGESRTNVEKAIKAGDLQTFVVGRRRFARPEAVRRWVDWLQQQSDKGRPIKYQPRAAE
jgi:hypothetical protein